jgi:hypothetical protein
VLVAHLKELQQRGPRFPTERFLESLFSAYAHLVEKKDKNLLGRGEVEKLVDIYELLTLLPGASRDYSKQDFARDIYLLDRSGVNQTRRGQVVSFPSSTGARAAAASTLRIVTEGGQEKVYYGIAFTRGA